MKKRSIEFELSQVELKLGFVLIGLDSITPLFRGKQSYACS